MRARASERVFAGRAFVRPLAEETLSVRRLPVDDDDGLCIDKTAGPQLKKPARLRLQRNDVDDSNGARMHG